MKYDIIQLRLEILKYFITKHESNQKWAEAVFDVTKMFFGQDSQHRIILDEIHFMINQNFLIFDSSGKYSLADFIVPDKMNYPHIAFSPSYIKENSSHQIIKIFKYDQTRRKRTKKTN